MFPGNLVKYIFFGIFPAFEIALTISQKPVSIIALSFLSNHIYNPVQYIFQNVYLDINSYDIRGS
jgi:hypothetical protein